VGQPETLQVATGGVLPQQLLVVVAAAVAWAHWVGGVVGVIVPQAVRTAISPLAAQHQLVACCALATKLAPMAQLKSGPAKAGGATATSDAPEASASHGHLPCAEARRSPRAWRSSGALIVSSSSCSLP
jgi:hypothetical protein